MSPITMPRTGGRSAGGSSGIPGPARHRSSKSARPCAKSKSRAPSFWRHLPLRRPSPSLLCSPTPQTTSYWATECLRRGWMMFAVRTRTRCSISPTTCRQKRRRHCWSSPQAARRNGRRTRPPERTRSRIRMRNVASASWRTQTSWSARSSSRGRSGRFFCTQTSGGSWRTHTAARPASQARPAPERLSWRSAAPFISPARIPTPASCSPPSRTRSRTRCA